MKLGLNITEKEYRNLDYASYSLLSGLSKAGPDAMYGVRADISDIDGIIIGTLVDSLITDNKLPSNLIIVNKKPTGKPLSILKKLATREDLVNKKDLLSNENKKAIEEELNAEEYYKTSNYSSRVTKLKNYKNFARGLVNSDNSIIATDYQLSEAKQLVNAIKLRYDHLFTEDTLMQIKLLGEVNGAKLKCMLDFIVIDHKNKILKPYDLKTGINPHHKFFETGFLSYGYYIQASLYKYILEQNVESLGYKVDNFRFLYCGRMDKLPIVYKVSDKFHKKGFEGFTYQGVNFPGINELIEDFLYYKEHPNAFYRRGYDTDEVLFDDSFL